jgi:hypothetical protein
MLDDKGNTMDSCTMKLGMYKIQVVSCLRNARKAALPSYEHPKQEEYHKHTEHLSDQPAVARHPVPILEQFSLGTFDILAQSVSILLVRTVK